MCEDNKPEADCFSHIIVKHNGLELQNTVVTAQAQNSRLFFEPKVNLGKKFSRRKKKTNFPKVCAAMTE